MTKGLHKMFYKIVTLAVVAFAPVCFVYGQTVDQQLRAFVSGRNVPNIGGNMAGEINFFYAELQYQTAWIQNQNRQQLNTLLTQIKSSPMLALKPEEYDQTYIEDFNKGALSLRTANDSLQAEMRITEAAIRFYSDISTGNTVPQFGYTGVNRNQDRGPFLLQLTNHTQRQTIAELPVILSPALNEVTVLIKKIRQLSDRNEHVKDIIITTDRINKTPPMLAGRFYQLGLIDEPTEILTDSSRKQMLRAAQRMFNLTVDGVLNRELMQELNVPVPIRIRQLKLAVNYYRWLSGLTINRSVIVVNIPAAYLRVYRNNEPILSMRMIVGKPSTPTPTLSSIVQEVVLYPYWHVPYSIATKEILPILKRDPGYIKSGNYQVLNSSGKIINAGSINWASYSSKYFPFTLRQSTGCDNALGLLKLNFNSPFGVYLHDTPIKLFFNAAKRFMSHGCMRMENPLEMGHLVLENNKIAIDTLTEKGCIRNQSPIVVPADVKMPVIVWYNPAGINNEGEPVFYQDIYKKFKWSEH
ncbi:MAG: L,D-transpeptidase family protein [Bacteroidota bacterium]